VIASTSGVVVAAPGGETPAGSPRFGEIGHWRRQEKNYAKGDDPPSPPHAVPPVLVAKVSFFNSALVVR
jgi:hypothetical protein